MSGIDPNIGRVAGVCAVYHQVDSCLMRYIIVHVEINIPTEYNTTKAFAEQLDNELVAVKVGD